MQEFLNKNYAFGPLVISLLTCLIALLAQGFLPPEIPLFYGLPVGREQLSPAIGLIIPGGLGFGFSLINLLLWLKIKDEFLKKIIMIGSYIIIFFVFITTLKIISIVGNF